MLFFPLLVRMRMCFYTEAKKHGEMHLPIYFLPYGICDYHEGMSITIRVRLIFGYIYMSGCRLYSSSGYVYAHTLTRQVLNC